MATGKTYPHDAFPLEHINAREVPVYGWQKKHSPRYVWGMAAHLLNGGKNFWPVMVEQPRDDGSFYLDHTWTTRGDSWVTDGGHHRVLAHILADVPLPVRITDSENTDPNTPRKRIPLVDTELGIIWHEQFPPDIQKVWRSLHRLDPSFDLEGMRQTLANVHENFVEQGLLPKV